MEFLKEYLGDELYNKVAEKLQGNAKVKLANLATGEYVGKDKFLALETTKQDLEKQLSERDKQLDSLKKTAGDNEALKTEITRLQAENTATRADLENKLKEARLDYALEARLLKEGAVNTKAVKALLDHTKLSLDGDNLLGLDEQLKNLKEAEKWAFAEVSNPVPGAGGNPPLNEETKKKPYPLPDGPVTI